MSGRELFEKYRDEGSKDEASRAAAYYAGILMTASLVVSEQELYSALEEAEKQGKKIDLTYPIPFDQGPSEPSGIELV